MAASVTPSLAPGSVSDENIRAMLQATGEPRNQLFASPLISSLRDEEMDDEVGESSVASSGVLRRISR